MELRKMRSNESEMDDYRLDDELLSFSNSAIK